MKANFFIQSKKQHEKLIILFFRFQVPSSKSQVAETISLSSLLKSMMADFCATDQ